MSYAVNVNLSSPLRFFADDPSVCIACGCGTRTVPKLCTASLVHVVCFCFMDDGGCVPEFVVAERRIDVLRVGNSADGVFLYGHSCHSPRF